MPQRCHIQRVTFKNASKSQKIHKKILQLARGSLKIPPRSSKTLDCATALPYLTRISPNPRKILQDPFKMLRGTSLATKLRYFNQNLTEKLQIAAALPHFNRSSKDCNHPAGILPEFAGILTERAGKQQEWLDN